VADAAEAADMSRATAYRYFATQHELLTAVMGTDVAGIVAAVHVAAPDPRARLEALVDADYDTRRANETQLRTWLRISIEQHRQGGRDEERIPRGGRIQGIEQALGGLQEQVGGEMLRRLSVALSLLIGTESFLILKDVWELEGDDAKAVIRWAALALLDSATEAEAQSR
jgi:AcrR family transcriptional regulator